MIELKYIPTTLASLQLTFLDPELIHLCFPSFNFTSTNLHSHFLNLHKIYNTVEGFHSLIPW